MEELIVVLLPTSTIAVWFSMFVALIKAINVARCLNDHPGGELAKVIVGSLGALVVSQGIIAFAAAGVLLGYAREEHEFRWGLVTLAQCVVLVASHWSFIRLSRLD